MSRLSTKFSSLFFLLKHNQIRVIISIIKNWIYSDAIFIGCQFDLSRQFDVPPAKIDFRIRLYEESDMQYILGWLNSPPIGYDSYLVLNRINLIKTGLKSIYIGVDNKNTPCSIIWLIKPDENEKINHIFRGVFPKLNDGDILFENVYIAKSHRGLDIHPYVTKLSCDIAREEGMKRAILFIDIHNTATIRGVKKAGFIPFTIRIDRWRLFRRKVDFFAI